MPLLSPLRALRPQRVSEAVDYIDFPPSLSLSLSLVTLPPSLAQERTLQEWVGLCPRECQSYGRKKFFVNNNI